MTEPVQPFRAALADRYVIEREIGRGGMATVYAAEDVRHHRQVAVKVLRPELAATLGVERFFREIETAARLQHPHILSVHDSGEAAGQLWFTMPYVEGESLRERLRRERQLPLEDALRIATEAALALDYAHRHGVIHRDIKPENILLCDGQAVVADFGVGRALGLHGHDERLTETGVVVGTPAYMSPEQASGDQALDGRTDVYSLGLVLYEMLAGEVPFSAPTAQAILARRLTGTPRPLREVRETVPDSVERAVLKALAKSPADRFRTAADFAGALATPAAPPPAHSDITTAALRRASRWAIPVTGALAAVLVTVSVFLVAGRKTKEPALDATLVAVVPFDVPQPALNLWHEGLVDLLARNLDGAGPLRTVSPTVVLRRWQGRADRGTAAALARSTGAGVAVYGTLVGTGGDSVRLTANVLDVQREALVGEAEFRGTSDHIDQLADSITLRILRELARSRPIGAARASGFGTRSVPALRSFLHGEQFFRRTEWDSARTSYERAVELDSTFALAYWRLGTIRGWQAGGDSLGRVYSQRAAALNHGLPQRESLLVLSDSLGNAVLQVPDSAGREILRRLFSTTERVTTLYGTDPEAWVALGEARYHSGHGLGVTDSMMFEAFDRAVTLDPSYAPAYIHLVNLALRVGSPSAARHYAKRYLELRPGGEVARISSTTSLLLDPTVPASQIDRLLDTVSNDALHDTWLDFLLVPDSAEVAIDLARRVAERRIPAEVWYGDSGLRQGFLMSDLAFRGHLREAARYAEAHPNIKGWAVFTELALAGAVPADSGDAYYRRRLDEEPLWSPKDDPLQLTLILGPVWWAARGDSLSLERYVQRLRRETHRSSSQRGAMPSPYWLAASEAYLALARRDTAQALARLAALPNSTGPVWFERLTLSRLLAGQGNDRAALAVLDRGFPLGIMTGSHGTWALERARLADKLGERDKARHWYGYVAALWRHADPELQPSVSEAREALARLTAESQR